jgi:hypothetical protein
VEITEGDTLVVTVTNKQIYPVTMHWCVPLFSYFFSLLEYMFITEWTLDMICEIDKIRLTEQVAGWQLSLQAWNQAVPIELCRWASLHHTVPYTNWRLLYLSVYSERPTWDIFLSCPYQLVESHSSWCLDCSPQAESATSLQGCSGRDTHHHW